MSQFIKINGDNWINTRHIISIEMLEDGSLRVLTTRGTHHTITNRSLVVRAIDVMPANGATRYE